MWQHKKNLGYLIMLQELRLSATKDYTIIIAVFSLQLSFIYGFYLTTLLPPIAYVVVYVDNCDLETAE